MTDKTRIEWTDATWNPIRGCSRVSEGCRNCYAEKVAARFSFPAQQGHITEWGDTEGYRNEGPYHGLIGKGGQWNGQIKLVPGLLDQPLRWRKPRRIFVNSMSDLFHEEVPDTYVDKVFAVMAMAHWHKFQVLTKRPERMLRYFQEMKNSESRGFNVCSYFGASMEDCERIGRTPAGLPNVWLGVSVEDQKTADERIPLLLETPAAVRWISAEPLLGQIDLTGEYLAMKCGGSYPFPGLADEHRTKIIDMLDWVVVGGESGPGARPMHPEWARSLRDRCVAAGVPFFFKQWGEFSDQTELSVKGGSEDRIFTADGTFLGAGVRKYGGMVDTEWREKGGAWMSRVGKKQAGRLLDGREWNEYPKLEKTS